MATPEEEEDPFRFPDDFDSDLLFFSPVDWFDTQVAMDSPFDHVGTSWFRRMAAYIAQGVKFRPSNFQYFRMPPPLPNPRPQPLPRVNISFYRLRMEAQVTFLRFQHWRQMSVKKKLKVGFSEQKKEAEELRRFVNEVAADIRSRLHGSPKEVVELKKLIVELTQRLNSMEAVNTGFSLKKVETAFTLRHRIKSIYGEIAYFSSLVTLVIQAFGWLQPKKPHGPPTYELIDKNCAELLQGDYCQGLNLQTRSIFGNGMAIATGMAVLNGITTSSLFMSFAKDKLSVQIKSNLHDVAVAKASLDEAWGPNVKLLVLMGLPHNAKVGFRSLHKYGAFKARLGLNANPLASASFSLGTKEFSFGGFLEMNTYPMLVRRYSVGFTVADDLFKARLSWDMNSVLKASFHCQATDATAVATECVRNFTTGDTLATFGIEHALDDYTKVKTRISDDGSVAAMLSQQLSANSSLALCTDFNFREPYPAPRFGLSFSFGN